MPVYAVQCSTKAQMSHTNPTQRSLKMRLLRILASLVSLLAVAHCAADYDAEKAMGERTNHYREACAKYDDPRRPEYRALFEATLDLKKFRRNVDKKVFVCSPLKVASEAFYMLFKQLHMQFRRRVGKEAFDAAMAAIGNSTEDQEKFFKESARAVVVRHPLERLLSTYLFIFVDSSTHRDLSHKVKENWLSQRKDKLSPVEGEDEVDAMEKPTLTFRQFVNFLTKCRGEYPECTVLLNDGIALHWMPYWRWCQPCNKATEYHHVLELGPNIDKDKEFLFEKYGLNNTVPLKLRNPTKAASASNESTKEKYYGQLSKQEIYDLYLLYKLDHELFGYSPEAYLKYGKDAP